MAVKLIKRGDPAKHERDALVLTPSNDYSDALMASLDARYGTDGNGSLLKQWMAWAASQEGWVPGKTALLKDQFGQAGMVILVCISDREQKAIYPYIRDALQKIVMEYKDIKTVAVPIFDCKGPKEVTDVALEPVIAAAVGDRLHVDLYQSFAAEEKK